MVKGLVRQFYLSLLRLGCLWLLRNWSISFGFHTYEQKVSYIPLQFFNSCSICTLITDISDFCFLSFIFVSLVGFSSTLLFSKNQISVSLIIFIVFLLLILLISALYF